MASFSPIDFLLLVWRAEMKTFEVHCQVVYFCQTNLFKDSALFAFMHFKINGLSGSMSKCKQGKADSSVLSATQGHLYCIINMWRQIYGRNKYTDPVKSENKQQYICIIYSVNIP